MKPWLVWNNRGWLLCLMCPTGKWTNKGATLYFLGVRWSKASRKKRANWLRAHRRCGFEVRS